MFQVIFQNVENPIHNLTLLSTEKCGGFDDVQLLSLSAKSMLKSSIWVVTF